MLQVGCVEYVCVGFVDEDSRGERGAEEETMIARGSLSPKSFPSGRFVDSAWVPAWVLGWRALTGDMRAERVRLGVLLLLHTLDSVVLWLAYPPKAFSQ
jgi:hypothetical protein